MAESLLYRKNRWLLLVLCKEGGMMKVTKKDVENLMYDHLIETFSNLLNVLIFDEMKVGLHKGNRNYDECMVRLLVFEEICNEMGIWDEFSKRDEELVDKFRTIKKALGKDGMEVVSRRIDSQKAEEAYLIYIIETYKEIVNLIPS